MPTLLLLPMWSMEYHFQTLAALKTTAEDGHRDQEANSSAKPQRLVLCGDDPFDLRAPESRKPMPGRYPQEEPRSARTPGLPDLAPLKATAEDGHRDQVKCKNCGAFGHQARNPRCPIRRWQGALVLQPLRCLKGKENMPPRCEPVPSRGPDTPKVSGPGLIPGRGSLLQRCPTTQDQKVQAIEKEGKESWDYVRQPCRAQTGHVLERPVQAEELPRRPHRGHPELSPMDGRAPGLPQSCVPTSRSPTLEAARTPGLAPSPKPRALIQFEALGCSDGAADHSEEMEARPPPPTSEKQPRHKAGQGPRTRHAGPWREQPARHAGTRRRLPALGLQSQQAGGLACPGSTPPPTWDPAGGRPLTMVFRRLHRDQWSCGFLAAPELPAHSPPAIGPTLRPFSVLYEDLLVSSSSDESEQD
ncbi:protein FAM90A27P-like [Sorex araneus]|uniref:protein FAM90A27P-like n=1 Tax=Sorex araneus TaxID=42254 RepID=UPI002433483D|nr:protein FAM90A27P-like [Sorex araneus]